MYSEPRKIVLAGLVVSAVAIVAYVSQAAKPWHSTDEFDSARGEMPAHRTRGNTISGAVISAPSAARGDSGGAMTGNPQAARNSAPRNDLAAAQAQAQTQMPARARADAAGFAHAADDQVSALPQEPPARADNGQRAVNAARVETPPHPAVRAARTVSSIKHGRSRESRVAVREQSNRASSDATSQGAMDNLVARVDSNSVSGAKAPVSDGPAVARQASSNQVGASAMPGASGVPVVVTPPLVQQMPPKPPVVLAEPQAAVTTSATVPSPPLAQSMAPDATVAKSAGGPKTRSQVREEIARARQNGALPAFGNPDPAGPGGAPSLTTAPRP